MPAILGVIEHFEDEDLKNDNFKFLRNCSLKSFKHLKLSKIKLKPKISPRKHSTYGMTHVLTNLK